MDDSLNKRINTLYEHENLTRKEFSELTGIPESTLHSAHAKDSLHTLPVLKKIHDVFPEYNLEWLFFGEGKMLKGAYQLQNSENLITDKILTYKTNKPEKLIIHQLADSHINFFPLQKIEKLTGAINKQVVEIKANIPYVYFQHAKPDDAAILITDEEMTPLIPAYSYLHIRKMENPWNSLKYGKAYLLELSGKWQVRIIQPGIKATNYKLESPNPEISPANILRQRIKSIWEIIHIVS